MQHRTPYKDLLAMVREWTEKQDAAFDAWRPRWDLAGSVEGAYNSYGNLDSTYCSQVLRALNALADEGVLVKERNRVRDPQFWTAEAHGYHVIAVEQAAADSKVRRARWDVAYARLVQEGFAGQVRGLSVTFGLEDVERLVDRFS